MSCCNPETFCYKANKDNKANENKNPKKESGCPYEHLCSLLSYGFLITSIFVPYWININGDSYGPVLKATADGKYIIRPMSELICSIMFYLGLVTVNHKIGTEKKMSLIMTFSLASFYTCLLTIIENASLGPMTFVALVYLCISLKHIELSQKTGQQDFPWDDVTCYPTGSQEVCLKDMYGNVHEDHADKDHENHDVYRDYLCDNFDFTSGMPKCTVKQKIDPVPVIDNISNILYEEPNEIQLGTQANTETDVEDYTLKNY